MHKGCCERGRVCVLPALREGEYELVEYFCSEHAFEAGYCFSCGVFWAGCESFDFGGDKLCEHCRDQVRADFEHEGPDDEDWFPDPNEAQA